jgi:uncharacterized Zn finger protein (UPF0148 family)
MGDVMEVRHLKRCPGCGGPLTHKGGCFNPSCEVYRIEGEGIGARRKSKIIICSTPRDRPLTDAEVRELVYGGKFTRNFN